MKCPECSFNQKAKDGLRCGKCGYQFTFNPKESATRGITDGKFLACIRSASQNNTIWFTENQLYAAYSRQRAVSRWPGMYFGLVVAAIGSVLCLVGSVQAEMLLQVGISVTGLGLIIAFFSLFGGRKIRPAEFQKLLRRWQESGKRIDRLLEQPSLHDPPPEWDEPDIYDYGVEQILIVERDLLVDLLVKNGLHAEHRMLVLAESGYPNYLLPVAQRLLDEHPELPVFLLHDATAHGRGMEERVRASEMLPLDGHPVTDLGMFPEDFQKLKRTVHFDPDNKDRALPADAMLLPFLVMGLSGAMAEQMAFSSVIEAQQRGAMHDSGFG